MSARPFPHPGRVFVADTTALILFFTTTGIVNERFIADMAWEQVLHARLLGAVLMVPVGRPYGLWRDWLMRRAGPGRVSRLFWDTIALVTFQVPIYAAIIAVSGVTGRGLLMGVLGATAMMLLLGRPYGAFLNTIRGHVRAGPRRRPADESSGLSRRDSDIDGQHAQLIERHRRAPALECPSDVHNGKEEASVVIMRVEPTSFGSASTIALR